MPAVRRPRHALPRRAVRAPARHRDRRSATTATTTTGPTPARPGGRAGSRSSARWTHDVRRPRPGGPVAPTTGSTATSSWASSMPRVRGRRAARGRLGPDDRGSTSWAAACTRCWRASSRRWPQRLASVDRAAGGHPRHPRRRRRDRSAASPTARSPGCTPRSPASGSAGSPSSAGRPSRRPRRAARRADAAVAALLPRLRAAADAARRGPGGVRPIPGRRGRAARDRRAPRSARRCSPTSCATRCATRRSRRRRSSPAPSASSPPSAPRWCGSRARRGPRGCRATARSPDDEGALVRGVLDAIAADHPAADELVDVQPRRARPGRGVLPRPRRHRARRRAARDRLDARVHALVRRRDARLARAARPGPEDVLLDHAGARRLAARAAPSRTCAR